jgi:hypothetical protein
MVMPARYFRSPQYHRMIGLMLVLVGVVTSSCKRRPPIHRNETLPNPSAILQPLQGNNEELSLALEGASSAELRLPLGTTQPASIIAVLGLDNETRKTKCSEWHRVSKKRFFVLCPRNPNQNLERQGQFEWYDRELRLGLRAAKRKLGDYVNPKTVTLIGLPNAADAVVVLARRAPEFFPRIALVRRGFSSWTAVDSARFAKLEEAKALLVCDHASCSTDASRVYATLYAVGAGVKLISSQVDVDAEPNRPVEGIAGYREGVEWLLEPPRVVPQDHDAGAVIAP